MRGSENQSTVPALFSSHPGLPTCRVHCSRQRNAKDLRTKTSDTSLRADFAAAAVDKKLLALAMYNGHNTLLLLVYCMPHV